MARAVISWVRGLQPPRVRPEIRFERLRPPAEFERQEKALVFTQFREITAPLSEFLQKVFGRPGLVLAAAAV